MTDKQPTDQVQKHSTMTFFEIEKSLQRPYPAWLLTPKGSIVAANLLALWLWDIADPKDLLGANAFDILSQNLGRIPLEGNYRFFKSKTAQVKQLSHTFGSGFYTSFIEAMQRDPSLKKIYVDQQKLSWQEHGSSGQLHYALQITLANPRTSVTLLKFQVTLSSFCERLGYFATCLPLSGCQDTETLVQEVYRHAEKDSAREYCYLNRTSQEAQAAVWLILLHLLHIEPEKSVPGQLLWGLALMKVIEEGLTRAKKDTSWEPQSAFRRIRNTVKSNVELFEGDQRHQIIEHMRMTLDTLHAISHLDKKNILALLDTFIRERKDTLQLSNFLNEELRIEEAAQQRMVAAEEPEEEPQFDRAFQEAFCRAMTAMLSTKEDVVALTCFRRAYEYRKQFPWLPESREIPDVIGQNGLSYALRSALVSYIVCSPEEARSKVMSVVIDDTAEEEPQYSDREWTTRLQEAIAATVDEAFSLERFENHLIRAHVDITANGLDTLRLHIATALVRYYERRKMAVSADPF